MKRSIEFLDEQKFREAEEAFKIQSRLRNCPLLRLFSIFPAQISWYDSPMVYTCIAVY